MADLCGKLRLLWPQGVSASPPKRDQFGHALIATYKGVLVARRNKVTPASVRVQSQREWRGKMADIDLTQSDADGLIAMEKHRLNDNFLDFPGPGERLGIPLQSPDRRESFVVDVTRSTVKLTKGTYQSRARQVVVLLRLDIEGAPHRNPDGTEIACPHLHIYREGFADKWAFPAPSELLPKDKSLYGVLDLFMTRCNVTLLPNINKGLF